MKNCKIQKKKKNRANESTGYKKEKMNAMQVRIKRGKTFNCTHYD